MSEEEGSGEPDLPPNTAEFSPSTTISTNKTATVGTCTGMSYRCDGSGRWMEGQERKPRRNREATKNAGSVLW